MSTIVPLPAPRSWSRIPAGQLFIRQRRTSSFNEPIVTAFRDGQVTARTRRRTDGFTNAVQEIGYQGVRRGDLVIHSMDGFAGAIGVSDSDGKASPVVHAYVAADNADARFFAYMLRTLAYEGFVTSLAKGIRERSTAFDAETFRSLAMPTPPLAIQSAIADYLDRETARIDALILTKQRTVELVDEREAAWLHALLSMHRDLSGAVPLKSVVRWVEGPGIMNVDFRDDGVPLLRIRNLVGDTIDLTGCGHVPESLVRERWHHLRVRAGELLVSGSARSGTPVVIPPEANGAVPYTGLIRMWPTSPQLTRDYLRLFLASPVFHHQINRLKTGVGLQHWGPYHLAQISIPLPTVSDQDLATTEFRARETGRRAFTNLQRQQIALLQERRRTLITTAVTGQLEVSEAT